MIRLVLTFALVAVVLVNARGTRPQARDRRLNQQDGLAGSCDGRSCNGLEALLPDQCACDTGCLSRGDCCDDYFSECVAPLMQPSCASSCGGESLSELCYCDALCLEYDDCCEDFVDECATCDGACGCAAPSGTCWCNGESEPACSDYNDTCADVVLPPGYQC